MRRPAVPRCAPPGRPRSVSGQVMLSVTRRVMAAAAVPEAAERVLGALRGFSCGMKAQNAADGSVLRQRLVGGPGFELC